MVLPPAIPFQRDLFQSIRGNRPGTGHARTGAAGADQPTKSVRTSACSQHVDIIWGGLAGHSLTAEAPSFLLKTRPRTHH